MLRAGWLGGPATVMRTTRLSAWLVDALGGQATGRSNEDSVQRRHKRCKQQWQQESKNGLTQLLLAGA